MTRCCLVSLLFALFGLLGASMPARAAASAWAQSDQASVRLIAAVQGTDDLSTVPVGLEVELAGNWKTYWRSPGDAGLPPALDWKGSRNVASTDLLYPAPQRISVLGLETFGYKHHVLFPIDVQVRERGKPLDLKLRLDLLVCEEQCIPKTFDLALDVPAGPATPDGNAQLLAKARAAVPGSSRDAGLKIESVEEVSDHGRPALQIVASAEQAFDKPDVIAELQPDAGLRTPRIKIDAGGRRATFDLVLSKSLPAGARLTGRAAILTMTDGARALESKAVVAAGANAAEEDPGPSLVAMLGVALLGGLVLNLMPCVLPVLSLKLIGVLGKGGRPARSIRAGFLATACGVLASFLLIAGALAALKLAGHTIGWGIQFQQPAFIATMAVLVTFFACHLAGFVEIPLPRFIADAAARRQGPDENLASHFLTGAFATLLATPCSAPFLGTAVGFALAADTIALFAIFFALGLGLAAPYLVVAAVPQLIRRMPKPGRWMLRLKQALAVPLIATAVWLMTILASQTGAYVAFVVAASLLVLSRLLMLWGRPGEARAGIIVPAMLSVIALAIGLPVVAAKRTDRARSDERIAWQTFDRDRIRSLVSQGKTVFVDVTADWCLTCQANKRFVLSKDPLATRLNASAVSMKADWTQPDDRIGAYLASYGRYGIPFNIVYGPGAAGGLVLPELLTPAIVDNALDLASGASTKRADARGPTP